jgi:hypothetical protein
VRVWEHEDSAVAAERIIQIVASAPAQRQSE